MPVGHVPPPGHTADVAQDPYPFSPSLAALNTLVLRVVYLSPILIEAFFARPTALRAPQCVERSDQIEGTEATRGPRRLKGLVTGSQGHGEHPAAASRRRIFGKKFTTTPGLGLLPVRAFASCGPSLPLH